jgi:hypothetical protein
MPLRQVPRPSPALRACSASVLVYGVGVRSLTRRLLTSRERLRLTESLANSGGAYSRTLLWVLFNASPVFVIGGIGMVLDRQVGMGLLSILIFGASGTLIGYMLRMRA